MQHASEMNAGPHSTRPLRLPLLAIALALCLPVLSADSASSTERTPRLVASAAAADSVVNFSLLDYRGKYHELRRSEARAVVLYFTSFNCNRLRASLGKIRTAQRQAADQGVDIWLVNASTKEDPSDALLLMMAGGRKNGPIPDTTKIDAETLRMEVLRSAVGSIPVLRDEQQLVARRLGVTTSGEVVVIDPKELKIIYRGAIDEVPADQAGKAKPAHPYLITALAEFLSGKPVSVPKKIGRAHV